MAKDDQSSSNGLSRSWAILGIVYAAFFYWYTSFGGPFSEEEIAHFTEVLAGAPAMNEHSERWISFMKSDTGDDFETTRDLAHPCSSGANPSLRARSLFGGKIEGSRANPGLSAGPNPLLGPASPADRPISPSSETGNFCRRLGASASPALALESRSFPSLA